MHVKVLKNSASGVCLNKMSHVTSLLALEHIEFLVIAVASRNEGQDTVFLLTRF